MTNASGLATESKRTFRRVVRVSSTIDALPETVWGLLIDAADMPRWNSTVTSIDGRVALGERLKIRVPISKRTFMVTVDAFEPPRRLVWSDGNVVFRGVRSYTVTANGGTTTFEMEEVFTGVLLPLIAPSLPDFKPVFEQYAADLKKEAERH